MRMDANFWDKGYEEDSTSTTKKKSVRSPNRYNKDTTEYLNSQVDLWRERRLVLAYSILLPLYIFFKPVRSVCF